MSSFKEPEILFIHGRPFPHPMHASFAKSVNANYCVVDPVFRWNDRSSSGLRRYLSFLFSALRLPASRKGTVLISDGIFFMPALAKILWFYKKLKLIFLLDDEGLYFIESNFYSARTRYFAFKALQLADGFICIGQFQYNILHKLIHPDNNRVVISFNGIAEKRLEDLLLVKPDLESKHLIFIGNGPSGWRTWYKGLDLLIAAFQHIHGNYPDAFLTIIGNWDEETQQDLTKGLGQKVKDRIKFTGVVSNYNRYLNTASLYVHPARGEAWGISVTEAMAAGIPALVTNLTGTAEAVLQVSGELVTEADVKVISKRILWYFMLDKEAKLKLSERSREIASKYTHRNAVNDFQKKFNCLLNEIS